MFPNPKTMRSANPSNDAATAHSQRECDGNLRREREAESHLLARMDPVPTSIGLPFLLLRSFVSTVTERDDRDCLP